jgi:hypothetical protein
LVGALENDLNEVFQRAGDIAIMPSPLNPTTALVDAAIDYFSQSLFEHPPKIQESAISQIAACMSEGAFPRNPIRRTVAASNIVIALSKAIDSLSSRTAIRAILSERVVSSLVEVLEVTVA